MRTPPGALPPYELLGAYTWPQGWRYSMAGVEKALAQGADGVEVDVQLSQDSIPILYHDPTLNTD